MPARTPAPKAPEDDRPVGANTPDPDELAAALDGLVDDDDRELDADERAALYAELEAAEVRAGNPGAAAPDVTPRDRALALLLRDRQHLEGCPLIEGPLVGGALEADEYLSPAPPRALRARGVVAGDTVTTVRCRTCGGSQVYGGTVASNIRSALEAPATAGRSRARDRSL